MGRGLLLLDGCWCVECGARSVAPDGCWCVECGARSVAPDGGGV